MQSIEKMLTDGTLDSVTKKERLRLQREKDKMEKVLGGVAQMARLPAAVFIVDITHEAIALAEARRLNITTFGVVDTNADPTKVDFPIPANDDATKSIAIITHYVTAAIAEGLAERASEKEELLEEEEMQERDRRELSIEVEEEEAPRPVRGAKPSPPKRRVPLAGGGGRRPSQKR